MPWQTSTRKARLPKDWDRIRKPVLERCGYRCEYVRSDGRRCGSKATHVDHIVPDFKGGTDDPSNLQGLCPFHHGRKSALEGNEAKEAIRQTLKRPPEQNPGAIDPSEARPRPIPGM